MIDTTTEVLLPLSAAAREVPGGKVHVSTIHRWRMKGIHGIRLETVMRGGVRFTSKEALARFFERSTAAADGQGNSSPTTPKARKAAADAAERELAASGF